MKRRDVIKLGAVAAGAAALPSCAVPRMIGEMTGAGGADAFNAMLDQQLAGLDKPGLLHRLVEAHTGKPMSEAARAKIAEKDAAFRQLLGTLLITQGFRELPQETQVEPAVQDRMWRHIDRIGTTPFAVSDMLARLEPHERAVTRRTLSDRPDLPMELGAALDERAARVGMSRARRRQLRSMMAQAAFRLKNADPGVVIDEYVAKVDRMRESADRDAATLDLSRRVGEREFWRYQHLVADDAAASAPFGPPAAPPPPGPNTGPPGAPVPAPVPVVAPAQPPQPIEDVATAERLTTNARSLARRGKCDVVPTIAARVHQIAPSYFETVFRRDPDLAACLAVPQVTGQPLPPPPPIVIPDAHPGSRGLRTGSYMLGIGLATGAVSALLLSIGTDAAVLGVFGMTAAVILIGLGLLVLLVSALIYAVSD